MTRILFVCMGNIARSQLAEGLARSMATPNVEVASAGTQPNPKGVHPIAIELLRQRGIDTAAHHAKDVRELHGDFDYVITLCDVAAQQCPQLRARRRQIHWSIRDPGIAGENATQLHALFVQLFNELDERIRAFLAQEGLLRADIAAARR